MPKDFDIIGWVHDGEMICPNCLTSEESEDSEMAPVFVGQCTGEEICDRCGEKLTE